MASCGHARLACEPSHEPALASARFAVERHPMAAREAAATAASPSATATTRATATATANASAAGSSSVSELRGEDAERRFGGREALECRWGAAALC